MSGQGLTLDVWSEIVQYVGKDDLLNLCLVSRISKAAAARVLYRSITLLELFPYNLKLDETPIDQSQLPQSEQRGHWHLLSRLKSEANQSLRNLVRDVTVVGPSNEAIQLDKTFLDQLQKYNTFSKLLTSLPNLRRITIGIRELQTDHVIRTLCAHSRKPEVFLKLNGYDERLNTDNPLPCISSLEVAADPRSYRTAGGLLKFQQLVFSSPNLRSLSIAVLDEYEGRMIRVRRAGMHLTFDPNDQERFPPLEELALNGYEMTDGEAVIWQRNVQWDKLSSLTVGPLPCWSVLPGFAGYATSLKTLKVFMYYFRILGGEEARMGLESLLRSFDGLEVLDVKGFICSVSAVAQHRNLSTLCLHEDEPGHDDEHETRTVLTPADILYLDEHCPKLTSLALDVQKREGRVDDKAIQAIVTGFKNVRYLSIHFEMGLKYRRPIMPVINAETAQNIGQDIFDCRKQVGSSLSTVTIWTGCSHRKRLYWKPKYVKFESRFTGSYTIQGSGLMESLEGMEGVDPSQLSENGEDEDDSDSS